MFDKFNSAMFNDVEFKSLISYKKKMYSAMLGVVDSDCPRPYIV